MEYLEKSGTVSGRELHKKFAKLGMDRRRLTNQLVALLPEIFERGIYKKYAATIVEYAGKFGGLSKSVVMKRLRIERLLEGKPKLKELIVSEGVHKVALVASLATSADEEMWADKVENMSKEALFELAKEVRQKRGLVGDESEGGGLFDGDCEVGVSGALEVSNQKCQASPQTMKITLEGDLLFLFLKLKKQFGEHLTTTELLHRIFTESMEGNRHAAKRNFANPYPVKSVSGKPTVKRKDVPGNIFLKKKSSKITRYNPVAIQQEKLQETAGRCGYPGCNRPSDLFHHAERVAEAKRKGLDGDEVQKSITPMCKLHHEFAHNGLIENERGGREGWCLKLDRQELNWVDRNYRKWRRMGLEV